MENDVNIKVVIHRQDRIDYILSGVAEFYDIDRDELIRYRRNPDKSKRKKFAIKLLYDVADISLKNIAECMGGSSTSAVAQTYYRISDDVSPEYAGNSNLKKEYQQLLKYLRL